MADTPGGRSLVVDAVTHRYQSGALAVENINLDIKGGEIIALLGPSGCGKTTLLRIIAGFIAQTQGRIIIGDDIVDALPPNRRAVGIEHLVDLPSRSIDPQELALAAVC